MFTSIILCRRVSLWSTVSFHIYFKRKRAIWKRIKSCKSCLGIRLFVTLNNVLSLPKKLDWCYRLPQIGTFSVPAVREFNILPQYLLVNVAPPLWHPVVEAEKLRMKYIQQGSSLLLFTQVLGSLFAPSQKSKKLSHHFWVCFELDFGILNAPRKIFLAVYEPILKLQGLQGVGFQGKNGFTKMASNFSEIDFGFR